MFKKTIVLAALGLYFWNAVAASSDLSPEKIQNVLKTQVDGYIKLPVSGLSLVEAGGKTFLVSDNGRIVVVGKIIDMWNGVEIKNVDDVDKYAYTIDIKKLGINFDDLGALTIGSGKREVAIFVDPDCQSCNNLLQSVAKLSTQNYVFRIVMLPLVSNESMEKVKKGTCESDKNIVAKALLDNKFENIPVPTKDCNLGPLQKSIIAARVFGITTVPYLIRHDGRMQEGAPKDLSNWLNEAGVERIPMTVAEKKSNLEKLLSGQKVKTK